jgi:hypothetical protein
MNPTVDQRLLQLVSENPTTIAKVIDLMRRIDGVLPNNDGLKWFNALYRLVTEKVAQQPPAGGWQNPVWLTRLDVVFAGMYFDAISSALEKSTVASSWQAVFDARSNTNIDRIQFALAGMNAHINHDLSLALLQTDSELSLTPGLQSPEHADFEAVNDLLESVLPSALKVLATGVLGVIAQDTGKIGRLLAFWNVRAARDLAWDFADHLRGLPGIARNVALEVQDKVTGALGRSLLQRI